jgi:hypothetical protein
MSSAAECSHLIIADIVENVLLPRCTRCRMKILGILEEPYSTPFQTWYANRNVSEILCAVDPQQADALLFKVIIAAYGALDYDLPSIFEPQWASQSSQQTQDEEYIDD